MTAGSGSPARGGSRHSRLAAALLTTLASTAVLVPLLLLTHHPYPLHVRLVVEFGATATAAAWLGIMVDQPAAASLAGALAAAWVATAVYAATGSLTLISMIVLGVELGCVAAGRPGLALAGRLLPGQRSGGPAVILLAAGLIPLLVLGSLRVAPRMLGVAAAASLAWLARNPWAAVLGGGVVAALVWARPSRIPVLAGCAAGGLLAVAVRLARGPLEEWLRSLRGAGNAQRLP